jgi:hypothetical protein
MSRLVLGFGYVGGMTLNIQSDFRHSGNVNNALGLSQFILGERLGFDLSLLPYRATELTSLHADHPVP